MSRGKASQVANFYAGKSIFVTGATGFLGKTLIEKLLYSCNMIEKIYVLVCDKHGKSASERINEMTKKPVFDRLKMKDIDALKKIIPISGNLIFKNLGLSDSILEALEKEVSIVFHVAASTNFNLPLKTALNVNVEGTREVIQLCRRIKKLEAFVYVSTAFSNSDRHEVNEMVYQMPVTLKLAREVAEQYSDNDRVINKIIGNKPNTYTFSKAMAEELVIKECVDIPTAIVRPSIVMSSYKEPQPGWIDSWGGSTGMFVGFSCGTLKVVKGRGSNVTDLIPVDIVTNFLIVVATRCNKSKKIMVYNCCTGISNPITCDGATAIAYKICLKYSLNHLPWPLLRFTPSLTLYYLLNFVLQILPACIIDLWSLINGKPAIQLNIQSKQRKVVEAVKFFLLNQWKFSDDNVKALYRSLSAEDKEIFNFDVKKINWYTCIRDYVLGSRKHLLKLNDSAWTNLYPCLEKEHKVEKLFGPLCSS